MEIARLYHYFQSSSGVCTDTRKIKKNCLFVALSGEKFNANDFVVDAFHNGAAYALVDRRKALINDRCILVNDTLNTLQKLAHYHRNRFSLPIIAITGSNGKTTTRELVVDILTKRFNALATRGNLNNHIGVPLTLLELNNKHEIGVLEMGANHQGEIRNFCRIAEPTHGLITNIGKAHLEGFGGIDGVIKGKTELFDFIKEKRRLLFVNKEDELLMEKSQDIERIFYGKKIDNIQIVDKDPVLSIYWGHRKIQTGIIGSYNLQNIVASLKIGKYFWVADEKIIEAIENYRPSNNRSQVVEKKKNTLILDAYNANPSSMELALDNFTNYKTDHSKKLVILGDMLELGEVSRDQHQMIIEKIKDTYDQVILVGSEFKAVCAEHNVIVFDDSMQTRDYLMKNPPSDAAVLIKGSRGLSLENIIDAIP